MTIGVKPQAIQRDPRLGTTDRLQPLLLLAAIAVGLTIGQLAPGTAGAAADLVALGVFVLITLVMLNVNPRNVATTFTRKRFLGAALAINFVVNPLVAWALGSVFLADQPDLRIGLVLFLVTPCIGWYLIFTEMAGGDTELGVGLLGINVLLQILLLPLYLALFVGDAATIGSSTIVHSIALYLVVPVIVAAVVRTTWTRRGVDTIDMQRKLRVSSLKTLVLSLVLVAMFTSQADVIFDQLDAVTRLIVPMTLFFTVAYGVAIMVSHQLQLPHDQTALLVFTTASRNSEASLAIAATAFVSPMVGLTVALGPVLELPLLIIMTRLLQRRAAVQPLPQVSVTR